MKTRILLLAALLLATPAAASVLRPVDTAELVARADRILVGTVESQNAHWVDEVHSAIVTDVQIRVTRAIRGVKEGEVITVRRLGGSVDGIGMRVFGEAAYSSGEEILLFAEKRGDAYWSVGMTQGKLHVTTDAGRKLVHTDLGGAELLPAGNPQQSVARTAVPSPRLLDDVLRDVTTLMKTVPRKAPATQAVGR